MLLYAKPFVDPGVLKIAFFNEFMNSLYLYTDMMLTDFHGYDKMRDRFGSCLVLILGLTVGVNFFRLGWKVLAGVKNFVRRAKLYLNAKFGWFEPEVVAVKPFFD
jgi:hypothetical protein